MILKNKICHTSKSQNKRLRDEESAKCSFSEPRELIQGLTQLLEAPSKITSNLDASSTALTVAGSSDINLLDCCSREAQKRKLKRKAIEEGPNKKKRLQEINGDCRRDDFHAKYGQQDALGEGGCGQVFAGTRRADGVPVAIKHIPKEKILCKEIDHCGNQMATEVAIMLKLTAQRARSEPALAPVALLDWYDLEDELILVMERPVPCVDLMEYLQKNNNTMKEEQAKVIIKQLLASLAELEHQNIFHRDIKMENILIQTGEDFPRVRIIDFGMSCVVGTDSFFHTFYGTTSHIPPEWKTDGVYSAGPTTVWQVGVLLYEILHRHAQFNTKLFLSTKQKISKRLSRDCRSFLNKCLTVHPLRRSTLQQLLQHQWVQ